MRDNREAEYRGIFLDVMYEIDRAESIHPGWHEDLVRADAVVNEEKGEATKAVLNFVEYMEKRGPDDYDRHKIVHLTDSIDEEMIQTAAMAFRFLLHWRKHDRT